ADDTYLVVVDLEIGRVEIDVNRGPLPACTLRCVQVVPLMHSRAAKLQRNMAIPRHERATMRSVIGQSAPALEVTGWGGRIRTCECRYQKPVPYHLATPQQSCAHIPAQVAIERGRDRQRANCRSKRAIALEGGRAQAPSELESRSWGTTRRRASMA